METVLKAIADWIKGILTAGIMSNLIGLFDDVNTQVGNIAQQVGTKPSSFEPRVFAMIEALSRNVVLPIAGIILTFIACYELIEMITQHNNMAQFEPALIMRWIFKTAVSVWFISNTFDIVMAVFDLTQKVVSDSSGIIAGNTRVNEIGLSMLEASLMQMDVGPLFGLFLQSFFIGITMRIYPNENRLEGTLISILVIAEKTSVAMSYAKILGATNRQDGYLEGNGYLVSWCVGHLVELAPPNVYDEKYTKWSIADLPILPQKWQYLVSASTKKQFGILQKLMHCPDVESIVNSCDSGREGELIFRLVYQQAGCKKPFTRLWLSSMEENAIREGFAHLKPSIEYDALYNAALCRERADWIVGINASRLFSCLYGQPLAVGRVMTPVLAMTVVREAAIAAFVPEKFYTVDLELTSGCTASSRRIPEKTVAENLLEACRKEMVATIQRITRKEKSESPPSLYDLTTLQRDANRLLGYSAQQTLDYVQSLYEKKLTTYPRTDSCYITDDDEEMLEELTEALEVFLDITPEDVDEAVPRTRRTVNREKVTDHHAILPTRSMLQTDLDALPKGERNVLKLIIARTLMAVGKPFRYLETMLTTECAGEEFTAKGKEVLEEGWKAVERKVLADILNRKQELTALPNVAENECGILNAELKEGQTSPPKHFTEDLLLHAMETASADSMPEGVERQGIGTPATRAATIEKLVQKGFLERKGTKKTKVLLPTDKGKALITVMPEEIQSPEMTADWETKLLQIERGEMEPSEFMTEINTMITELVKNTEMKKGANGRSIITK